MQTLQRLNAVAAATVSPAAYDVAATGIGIVHIGPGAFHRAHQAVFTEDALAFGGHWRICGVQMRSSGVRDALKPQDYRYTLAVLDQEPNTRVIHALAEVLVASEELEAVLARMSAQSTHIVTMTITEKGYCLTPTGVLDRERAEIVHDLNSPAKPVSAIGLLVEGLRRRRESGVSELTIISCDNLPDNGKLLGAAVTAFAHELDASLAAWISESIAFPCTMVDSITPATDDKLRTYVEQAIGLEDAMPVSREAFSQWVIEDRFSGPRPEWEKAGVTFTSDVALFETAKIRLLNGAHSTLAYAGMLAGHKTVLEAISDVGLHSFVHEMMLREIVPTLRKSDDLNVSRYCEQILARFRNPEIAYRLAQIAWDGSQKIRFRLFDTIKDNLDDGRSSDSLIYAVAAWLHFVRRCFLDGTEMVDMAAQQLLENAAACTGNGRHDVQRFLDQPDLFAAQLRADETFVNTLVRAYDHIEAGGSHHDFAVCVGQRQMHNTINERLNGK